jgi:hypothetical protein
MWSLIIIIVAACVLFFAWSRIDYKRKKAERGNRVDKPLFRTDDDVQEYAKPMKDPEHSSVDLDDAE